MDLCLPNGSLHRYVHSRSEVEALPRLYNAMRKISWGGLIPSFMIEPMYTTMMRMRSMKQSEKDEKREVKGGKSFGGNLDESDLQKALQEFLAAEANKSKPIGKRSPKTESIATTKENVPISAEPEEGSSSRSRGANRRRSSLARGKNSSDV